MLSGISDRLQGVGGTGHLLMARLIETDFNLVINGFLGWSLNNELSEKYFSICS